MSKKIKEFSSSSSVSTIEKQKIEDCFKKISQKYRNKELVEILFIKVLKSLFPEAPERPEQIRLSERQYNEYNSLPYALRRENQQKINVSLASLMPKESIKGNCIIVYHGTSYNSYQSILNHSLDASRGGGYLGKGFYFTPVFSYAAFYATSGSDNPVVLEFKIIDFDKLKVRLLHDPVTAGVMDSFKDCEEDIVSQTGYVTNPLLTSERVSFKKGNIWQFLCKSNVVLKNHFRLSKAYFLPQ
jgi:hypothetical protein